MLEKQTEKQKEAANAWHSIEHTIGDKTKNCVHNYVQYVFINNDLN